MADSYFAWLGTHTYILMDTADVSKRRVTVHIHTDKKTCPMICPDKEKQGSRNTWKPFDSERGSGYQIPWLGVILRHGFWQYKHDSA